jgi:aspartyl-tRNA(Asn)/glutamyl-tRNA(Gln) amidotransferase subunit A
LSQAGARIDEIAFPEFQEIVEATAKGGFVAPEALALHETLVAERGGDYDPRVRSRIERGRAMTAAEYVRLGWRRAELMRRAERRTEPFDALVLPTCAAIAPRLDELTTDEAFFRRNALILRNTSLFNFLDRCAATLPIQSPGAAPVGLTIVGARGSDRRLLAMARGIETALTTQ